MKCVQFCGLCVFALKCLLFCIFIIDSSGQNYIVKKGDTVQIKWHHLIRDVSSCGKDLNLVQLRLI
jgi:hypothetical protein